MRATAVPAQVTTVEDRIIGNLSFSQTILIVGPLFLSAALFAILPPFMHSSPYKYLLSGTAMFVGGLLAIRIKGKIVALWIATLLRYNLRPKYYLFNKNSVAMREQYEAHRETEKKQPEAKELPQHKPNLPRLSVPETVRTLMAIENPAANLRFETNKKGGLHVRLTEVKEQS